MIKGYSYGNVAVAPISEQDFIQLKEAVGFTEEDEQYLKMAGKVLKPQVNEIIDLWYDFVGSVPHLLYYFTDGKEPIENYLSNVRDRFAQWIIDTCEKPKNLTWLNWVYEIGLRHHKMKKNITDNVESVNHIHLRYIIALTAPICNTIKQFMEKGGLKGEELEKAHQAWIKAVVLQVSIWSYPYAKEGEW